MNLLSRFYARLFGPASPIVERNIARMVKERRLGRSHRANRIENNLQKKFGIYISSQADIGGDLSMPHPTGIVIGAGCKIGSGVCIYQNVTLGAPSRGFNKEDRYPHIGDATTIYAGAVIVGPVMIGSHCKIGANSVVLCDVPDGATAVGAPAKIVLAGTDS